MCTVACERSVSRAEVQNNAEIGAEWAENRVIRSGNSASFACRPMSGRRTTVHRARRWTVMSARCSGGGDHGFITCICFCSEFRTFYIYRIAKMIK